jgi:hypothetical protein
MTGEPTPGMVAKGVARDRRDLVAGSVHDDEPQARAGEDHGEGGGLDACRPGLEPPNRGSRDPELIGQLALAEVGNPPRPDDVARAVEDLADHRLRDRSARPLDPLDVSPARPPIGPHLPVPAIVAATGDSDR